MWICLDVMSRKVHKVRNYMCFWSELKIYTSICYLESMTKSNGCANQFPLLRVSTMTIGNISWEIVQNTWRDWVVLRLWWGMVYPWWYSRHTHTWVAFPWCQSFIVHCCALLNRCIIENPTRLTGGWYTIVITKIGNLKQVTTVSNCCHEEGTSTKCTCWGGIR